MNDMCSDFGHKSSMPRAQSLPALDSANWVHLEETRERLECLLKQEEKYYLCEDYLSSRSSSEEEERHSMKTDPSMSPEHFARVVSELSFSPVSEDSLQNSPSSNCVKDLANAQAASALAQESKNANAELFGFWRQQMLDWSYLVIDSLRIVNRSEVAAVAFNILDRYVSRA